MSEEDGEGWKSAAFRANICKQIGDTREACQCYIPLQKSNEDLERLIFGKARHRGEYCALVARLILFMRNRAAVATAADAKPPYPNGSDQKSTRNVTSPLRIEPPPYTSFSSSSSDSSSTGGEPWNNGAGITVKKEGNGKSNCYLSSGTVTCQKMLSSIITVVSGRLGHDRQTQVRDLVQELVDGHKTVEQFTETLPKLLKTTSQPYLGPFLKDNIDKLRLALTEGELKIEGIHTPLPEKPVNVNGSGKQSRMSQQLMQTLARSMNTNKGVLSDEAIISRLRQSLSKKICPSPPVSRFLGSSAVPSLPKYSDLPASMPPLPSHPAPRGYHHGYGNNNNNQGLLATVPHQMLPPHMGPPQGQSPGSMMPGMGHQGVGPSYMSSLQHSGLAEGAQGLLALSGQASFSELGINSFLQDSGLTENLSPVPSMDPPPLPYPPPPAFQDNSCVVQMDGKTLTDLSFTGSKSRGLSPSMRPLPRSGPPSMPLSSGSAMGVLSGNTSVNGNTQYWDFNAVPNNNYSPNNYQPAMPVAGNGFPLKRGNGTLASGSKRLCTEFKPMPHENSLENFLFGETDFITAQPHKGGQS